MDIRTLAGYYFGNISVVKNNFTIVIIAIVFISILPGVIEYILHKKAGPGYRNFIKACSNRPRIICKNLISCKIAKGDRYEQVPYIHF